MTSPQSTILVADIPIHETHSMGFEPCLFLECGKCYLSVRSNGPELAKPCAEDIHDINNARIKSCPSA